MDTDKLIELAKAEAKKQGGWTPELEDAIRAGLIDGDRIHLGGKLVAHVHSTQIAMVNDGTETTRLALADLSQAQRERMLVLKGIQAGRVSHSIGKVHV